MMIFHLLTAVFSLLAWFIPVAAMTQRHRGKGYSYIIFSLAACAVSIQFQVFHIIFLLSQNEIVADSSFSHVLTFCFLHISMTLLLLLASIYKKRR